MKLITGLLLLLLLLLVPDANAYLDPGTGSMMLQVILGGIAAIGVAVKLYWHKLLAMFGRKSKSPDDEDTA